MKKFETYFKIPLLTFFGGICGAMGGADNSSKAIRRILLPLSYSGLLYQQTENILSFLLMSLSGILSMGYGIPDQSDTGSTLGKFWYKIFKGSHFWSDIFTRGTIGIFEIIILTIVPFLKSNWKNYILCSCIVLISNIFISWQNLGTYQLFNRKLSWSETILYGLITLSVVYLILQ